MTRIAPVVLLFAIGATAAAGGAADPTRRAIHTALSSDGEGRASAIAELRELGRTGLDAVVSARAAGTFDADDAAWDAVTDGVAAQRHARWSGLYWHTDLDDALAEAREAGKPVLSLRMLGDLRDAYSCANSRFFRTTLYSNPEVSAQMRDDYVLHWSSERPVPVVSIDMGDGRTLRSTLTGNSAHYVLDAEGRPLDVIPGLLMPRAFGAALQSGADLHASVDGAADRDARLRRHHAVAREEALQRLQLSDPRDVRGAVLPGAPVSGGPVLAIDAIPIAVGKGVVEQPLANAMIAFEPGPVPAKGPSSQRAEARAPKGWDFGPEHIVVTEHPVLHPRSIEMMRAQLPAYSDEEFASLLDRFEDDLGRDSVWNRDVLHTRIHDWFAQGYSADFDSLNARVYSEIFETPRTDPWLGLREAEAFTGLPNGGVE